MSDEDFRDIFDAMKRGDGDYPPPLKTATKAEYVTRARQMKKDKKPGCRLFVLMALGIFGLVLFAAYRLIGEALLSYFDLVMWMVSYGQVY